MLEGASNFKEEEPAGSSSNIFPREKGIESALLPRVLGSAFALSIIAGECLQALFVVCLQALFPLSMAYGISHFHAVRRGVEEPLRGGGDVPTCTVSEG